MSFTRIILERLAETAQVIDNWVRDSKFEYLFKHGTLQIGDIVSNTLLQQREILGLANVYDILQFRIGGSCEILLQGKETLLQSTS